MPAIVDFYYDLASPNAYLANQVVPAVAKRTGATFKIIPFFLGGVMKATNNQPPWITFASVEPKMAYMMRDIERFAKKHKLDRFKLNPHFPINTLVLMRGALVAEQDDRLADYISAAEKCMWEEGLKMDDPEVIVAALNASGLNGAEILESTKDPAIKAQLIKNTEQAVERGAFGAPTFFLGDEMFFGKDHLRDLEDELLSSA